MTFALRSRRLLLAGSAIILTLTACGDPNSTKKATGTTVAAAAAPSSSATPTSVNAEHRPRTIVVGGAAGSGTVSATGPATGSARPAADGMSTKLAAMGITYVYAGDVPQLPGDAPAWVFEPGATPDPAVVAKLAAAFGVTGSVEPVPADQGGGWRVGVTDGSGPGLMVGTDAMLSWWYSAPTTAMPGCAVTSGGAVGVDAVPAPDAPATTDPATTDPATTDPATPSTDEPTTIVEPMPCETTPPVGVPTADQAKAKATALLQAAGVDLSGFTLQTYADEWSANVTGTLQIDGKDTQLTFAVGFGAEGAVQWASGFLARPVQSDQYPLISVQDAVKRMNDQQRAWLRGIPMPLDAGVATGSGSASSSAGTAEAPVILPATAPGGPAATGGDDSSTGDGSTVDTGGKVVEGGGAIPPITACDPACPIDSAPPITVTLRNATLAFEQVWSPDGTVWLLPGYTFDADDGGRYSVVAVTDEFLQQAQGTDPTEPPATTVVPATTVLEPSTSEPATTTPTTVVSSTVPTTGSVDSTACSTDVTITPPFDSNDLTVDGLQFLVGLCQETADQVASGLGITVRPVEIDGQPQAVTDDFSARRVNVAVMGATVTRIVSIG